LEEKKFRGAFMAAIERALKKDTIVLCDSLNYIKGFRYQLYCIARALNTPLCVVHCAVTPEKSKEFNLLKPIEEQYDPVHRDELIQRYEEPISSNRWDSPLFTILADDEDFGIKYGQALLDSVLMKAGPKPKLSTVVVRLDDIHG
jgi:protein KTI12